MSDPDNKSARPHLSVVIPLLNEEGALRELHEKLTAVLVRLGHTYEILFVDDGSRDNSAAILDELVAADEHIGCVRFRRNFGKAAALDAGFKRVRGDIVVTMDADLQDDPEEIPRMLAKLDEGWDVVSGWKEKRHDPLGKTLPSKFFNFTVSRVSGVKLKDFNCGFKAYRREAIDGLRLYGELHRYVPVLVHWRGFSVTQISVTHHPRTTGVSKYGVERMLKGAFDLLTVLLITRYRTRPLHMFGLIGALLSVLGFVCLSYLTVLWFQGVRPIGTRPLFFLGLLLIMVGVQLVSTGLLGEMLASSQQTRGESYVIKQFSEPRSRHLELRQVPDQKPGGAEADPVVPGSGATAG